MYNCISNCCTKFSPGFVGAHPGEGDRGCIQYFVSIHSNNSIFQFYRQIGLSKISYNRAIVVKYIKISKFSPVTGWFMYTVCEFWWFRLQIKHISYFVASRGTWRLIKGPYPAEIGEACNFLQEPFWVDLKAYISGCIYGGRI